MLILISDAFDASLPERLAAFGEVTTDKERLGEANVVLVRAKTKCTAEYIDQAPNLKLIIRGGVGIDNIDKQYAVSKGIIVCNTPNASSIAVAELAMALMISVPANLVYYHEGMKSGQWLKNTKRTELYGKTLGLLGIGHIATEVAIRAKAFGMKVLAYDKYVKSSPVAEMVPTVEDAVKDADYVSLHLPLTDETRSMVNAELISKMTHKPVLVNTCRALVVDGDAVAKALEDGDLRWYCTDVYPTDPVDFENYSLIKSDKVTLTPHVGANSTENLLRIGDEVCELISKLIEERKI